MVKIEELQDPDAPPMEVLLGKELISDTASGKTLPTAKTLEKKDLVLLYFSASWCPPCQSFSPMLKEFYGHVSDQIEIIYIGSDKTIPEFEAYFGKMPWLSMPVKGSASIKQKLAHACHITGIPALVVLDRSTGNYINDQARTAVAQWKQGAATKESAKALVSQWKAQDAVPLSEANFAGATSGGIMGIVQTLARNPAYILGLFYMLKVSERELKKAPIRWKKTNTLSQLIAASFAFYRPVSIPICKDLFPRTRQCWCGYDC